MPTLLVAKRDGTVRSRVDLANRLKLTIGRSKRCDLSLQSSSISRRHALLFYFSNRWHLVDTGSKTGIFQGSDRWHHVVLKADAWVRLGPAYLWLDDSDKKSTVGQLRVEQMEPRTLDPSMALEGFDHALAGEVGVAGTPDANGDEGPSDESVTLVIADAAAGSLQRVELGERELTTVGRSTQCDIVLHDPDVSPIQCVLYTEQSGWCVAHAGKTLHSTRVEGRPSWRKRLEAETLVRIGSSLLWLENVAEPGVADEGEQTSAGELLAMNGEDSESEQVAEADAPSGPPEVDSAFFDDPADRVTPPTPSVESPTPPSEGASEEASVEPDDPRPTPESGS
jgi:pSer/pThr/pTyr-binding forkhead associated (FHA) protein